MAIAKRGKVTVFLMKKERPDEKTLLTHMLGPTGNLRAPAIRKGRTLLIGFDPDMYERFLL